MKRVLFTAAGDRHVLSDNLYPPLWPAYLAAYADRHLPRGSVDFRWDFGDIRQLLDRHRPDILAISSVTQNFGFAEQYARDAKKQGISVIVGGMHITSLPRSLSPDMDVACLGEGEETFCELLRLHLEEGRFDRSRLERIPGIAFGDGVITGPRPPIARMDDIPHPKRALVGYGHRAYVHTARGCAYACVFCSAARFWGKVRYASVDYILEELEELVGKGVRVIRFADDDFSSNVPRLEELAEKIQQKGIDKRVKFSCWCRANQVNPQMVRILRAMNVVSVKLGLESGSPRVLKYLKGAGVTVEENRSAVSLLKSAGLQVNADFLFGAPDETESEMMETYRFIESSPIDFFDINIFSPLPNTPVWDLARRRELVNERTMDWSRLNYKFVDDGHRAIHLSEKMNHDQLKTIHKRFQSLRRRRTVRAALHSPWRRELPLLALRAVRLNVHRRLARLFGVQ